MVQVATGTIGAGTEEYFQVVLTAGRSHRIWVHTDDRGVDFDLRVYDQNGNLVDADVSYSPDAFCIITPRWTGTFRLAVSAASGLGRYTLLVED